MNVVARRAPAPEDELTLAEIAAQMKALREIMDRDQAEIDRLKSETRAVVAETRRLLAQMQSRQPC